MRLHDLRHGAASLMPAAGIDMTVVSETLGHSTLGLTADTYTSVYRHRPAARLAPRSTPATFEDAAPRRVLASGTDSRCGARRRRSSRAAWCQIVPFWLLTYPWWATRLAAMGSGAAAPDIADRLGGVGHERGSTSGRPMRSPAIEHVDDHCNTRHSDERNRKDLIWTLSQWASRRWDNEWSRLAVIQVLVGIHSGCSLMLPTPSPARTGHDIDLAPAVSPTDAIRTPDKDPGWRQEATATTGPLRPAAAHPAPPAGSALPGRRARADVELVYGVDRALRLRSPEPDTGHCPRYKVDRLLAGHVAARLPLTGSGGGGVGPPKERDSLNGGEVAGVVGAVQCVRSQGSSGNTTAPAPGQ